jgi:hypothetical protein
MDGLAGSARCGPDCLSDALENPAGFFRLSVEDLRGGLEADRPGLTQPYVHRLPHRRGEPVPMSPHEAQCAV